MRDTAALVAEWTFTMPDYPKGKAEAEKLWGQQRELLWYDELESIALAREKLKRWIEVDYTKLYVHSELGYRAPEEFEGL